MKTLVKKQFKGLYKTSYFLLAFVLASSWNNEIGTMKTSYHPI